MVQLEKETQCRYCTIALFTRVHARAGNSLTEIGYSFQKPVDMFIVLYAVKLSSNNIPRNLNHLHVL